VRNIFIFCVQLIFLWGIYQFSNLIIKVFHIPVPASILGILILYTLLSTKIIKLKNIEMAASFLNKHLAFFFIPFAVGLMNYGSLVKTIGLQLMVMIIGSTFIGLAITSGLTQFFIRKDKKKDEHSHSL